MNLEVTFGKHRGHKIEDLVADSSYMAWLEQQGWWSEKWEYKVIAAVANGHPLPAEPKRRPVLEQEYDFAVERPTKVRNVTHRTYSNKVIAFECPNCGANDAIKITNEAHTKILCTICGQHATIKIGQFEPSNKWMVLFEGYECHKWEGKTAGDYARLCEACPKRKGIYSDHTTCGCWRDLECTCGLQ